MSHIKTTALGIGATFAGAALATFIGMGTGHAVPGSLDDADGYSDLYGALGTAGLADGQGSDNAQLDNNLFLSNPGEAASFDQAVDSFESNGGHTLTNLIFALDPSAFQIQYDPDIDGTFNAAGGYLVPDDALGYLATSVDFFLLDPLGLGFLLSPVVSDLAGSPEFF